jgi:hypothetical protein
MTRKLAQFVMNSLVLPAILHDENDVTIAELTEAFSKLPCSWSRFTGLLRILPVETIIGAPHYSTMADTTHPPPVFGRMDDEDLPIYNAVSLVPQYIHLTEAGAAAALEQKKSIKMGDGILLIAQTQVLHNGEMKFLTVLVGVVPWFNVSMAFNGSDKVDISLIIMNVHCSHLTHFELRAISRCERFRPLMPVASSASAVPLDSHQLEASAKKLLSFLLRWQQTRLALHPELVKSGVRVCDRANLISASKRLHVDVEKWRLEQKRNALNSRSFVFFGVAAPRKEIFESPHFWQTLLFVVSTFATPTLVRFIINEVIDVLEFIIEQEVLVKGELAIFQFCKDYLKPLCDGICEAQLDHLRRQKTDIPESVLSKTPLAQRTIDIFLEVNNNNLRKAETEQLQMRVQTIGELRDGLVNAAADSTALSSVELEALAMGVELDVNVMAEDQQSIRDDMTRNIVVVSHNFFCGASPLTDILYSLNFGKEMMESRMFMKRGRRHFTIGPALKSTVLVTRAFLDWHAHLEANGTRMTPLEVEFLNAAPKTAGLYPVEAHSTAFDDIAIGTDDFVVARATCNLANLKEFLAGRAPSMPLPADFNMALNRGLLVPSATLKRSMVRTGTLHSQQNGPVEVHRLALHVLSHRDACFKSRGNEAHNNREHIGIEFDTGGDNNARFDKLYKLEAFLPPLSSETLDTAVRAAAGGNRQKLDDIEDIVQNIYKNRGMPLCASRYAQYIDEKVGDGYLKNDLRLPFYKLMRSFEAPQVTPESIMRFMFRNSPASKIGDHYHEATTGWEKAVEKSHLKAAKSFAEVALENMREVTEEEAKAATTCSPSCSTMITRQHTCPFLLPDETVRALLLQSGVDADKVDRIMERSGNAGLQCKMHFEYSRAPETRSTPAFSDHSRDVYFKHPHQYMLAAADHLLRHKELSAMSHK